MKTIEEQQEAQHNQMNLETKRHEDDDHRTLELYRSYPVGVPDFPGGPSPRQREAAQSILLVWSPE